MAGRELRTGLLRQWSIMRVPFVDLSRQNVALMPELCKAFNRVVLSGRVLFGTELDRFEHSLASWFGLKHAIGVASGTDALEIALRVLGIRDGDRVQCPAFTAVPTINAVEAAGAQPRLVDVDANTRNATVPVDGRCIAVHLYGLPIVTDHRPLVEDCAHAMGATVDGRLVGTSGSVAAISFYPTKTLGALGDGGAIVTDDDLVASRAREVRHYGGLGEGDVTSRGQNSRLSELQAAFLAVKLPHVRTWNERRRAIAARYTAELNRHVQVPLESPGQRCTYYVYVIEHDDRDRLADGLTKLGVGHMVHYPKAIHEYARYSSLGEKGEFPVSERLARTVLSLPCYPELSEAEQDYVIRAVKDLT